MILIAALLSLQAEPGPLERLAACRAMAQDAARLACFDAVSEDLVVRLEAGDLVTIDRASLAEAERRSFGLPAAGRPWVPAFAGGGAAAPAPAPGGGNERRDEAGRLVALEAVPVMAARRLESGRLEVALSNGQVSRQTDSTRVRTVSPRRIEAGLTASVTPGALGSFFLRLDDFAPAFRAERVD